MQINFLVTALAALIPLILGFIWYNSKLFGNRQTKSSGSIQEKTKGAGKVLVLILSFIFGFMVAMTMNFLVIHQLHFYSILVAEPGFGDPDSSVGLMVSDFISKYGSNYRTFKHGAFHGAVSGIMLSIPVVGIHALYEQKNFRYIAIHAGFWIVNFILMGGVISAFA